MPCEQNPFYSLVENEKINFLQGEILSNPVKSASGKTYSFTLKVNNAGITEKDFYTRTFLDFSDYENYLKNIESGFFSSAEGNVKIYIPTEIVEAYYPGKLYSIAKNQNDSEIPIIESGLKLAINVSYLENDDENSFNTNQKSFYVKKIYCHQYESTLNFYRAYSRLILKRILYNWKEAGGLLLALVSGAKEYTSIQDQENFKKSGLAHVLALSGMHLSIFANLPKIFKKKNTELISFMFVLLFVWFAGLSPSLLRALISLMLGLFLKSINIKSDLIGVLSLTFLIQVSIFPNHVLDYGFILSYGALAGLALGEKLFLPIFSKFLPKKIAADFAASVGAQGITAPITLLGFGTCSPIGILASVIVSPVANIFLSLGIFALIISILFPFLLDPIGCIMWLIYVILTSVVNFFSKFPIIKM